MEMIYSSLCVLPLESLRSEEVKLKKRLFAVVYKHVFLMLVIEYTKFRSHL